jgi:hypothetical protein
MNNKDDEALRAIREMQTLATNYIGPIKKIPVGKRTTRGPSKKPGESGDWRHVQFTEDLHNEVWGR